MATTFNQEVLKEGMDYLQKKDTDLKKIVSKLKFNIPLFERPQGFEGIVNLIVEQQLSVASAKAIFLRIKSLMDNFRPIDFSKVDDLDLKKAGLSYQKISYCKGLANACIQKKLDFKSIENMNNTDAINYLIRFKGIGDWTAQCYLLACLSRKDAWPSSDLGLQVAIQNIKGLSERPDVLTTNEFAELWKPYRGVAALLLWSTYDK